MSIKEILNNPLAKDPAFLAWLEQQTNPDPSRNLFKDFLEAQKNSKESRLLFEGAFDVVHSGHYNALRQAKALSPFLVVGVNSDESITAFKGPPVMDIHERCALVNACKWVDEVAEATPYIADIPLLDSLNCQYIGHGDDIILGADGKSIYTPFIEAGRMKITKRTEGISTTDILGRILDLKEQKSHKIELSDKAVRFVNKASMLEQFMKLRQPEAGQKVVYVDGSFDLLHPGHVAMLKAAKERGDYLVVGVHENDTITKRKGPGFPVIDLDERVLCVLAMKYVDDVVIGAPQRPNEAFLKRLGISLVLSGKNGEVDSEDSYKYAKELGMYQEIDIGKHLTSKELIARIQSNEQILKEVFAKKKKKQEDMYNEIIVKGGTHA